MTICYDKAGRVLCFFLIIGLGLVDAEEHNSSIELPKAIAEIIERNQESLDSINPVRHKDCGVIYGGRITENFFCRLPILNLRAVYTPV